jgi:hypothetical protein
MLVRRGRYSPLREGRGEPPSGISFRKRQALHRRVASRTSTAARADERPTAKAESAWGRSNIGVTKLALGTLSGARRCLQLWDRGFLQGWHAAIRF